MVWQLWADSFILLVAVWVHTAPKYVVLIFYETVIQHLEIKSEVIFWQCFIRIGPYIEYRYTFNHGQTGRGSYTLAWFAKMGHYVGLNTRKKKLLKAGKSYIGHFNIRQNQVVPLWIILIWV